MAPNFATGAIHPECYLSRVSSKNIKLSQASWVKDPTLSTSPLPPPPTPDKPGTPDRHPQIPDLNLSWQQKHCLAPPPEWPTRPRQGNKHPGVINALPPPPPSSLMFPRLLPLVRAGVRRQRQDNCIIVMSSRRSEPHPTTLLLWQHGRALRSVGPRSGDRRKVTPWRSHLLHSKVTGC